MTTGAQLGFAARVGGGLVAPRRTRARLAAGEARASDVAWLLVARVVANGEPHGGRDAPWPPGRALRLARGAGGARQSRGGGHAERLGGARLRGAAARRRPLPPRGRARPSRGAGVLGLVVPALP